MGCLLSAVDTIDIHSAVHRHVLIMLICSMLSSVNKYIDKQGVLYLVLILYIGCCPLSSVDTIYRVSSAIKC